MRSSIVWRECMDCERVLPLSKFRSTKGYMNKCWQCANIWKRYRLTGKQFFRMLLSQMYRCLICETPIDHATANVDHCHDTTLVRGLLCKNCNLGIGHFKHDPEVTERAVRYLKDFHELSC